MITDSMGIIVFSVVTAIGLTILAAVGYVSSMSVPAEQQVHETVKLTTITPTATPTTTIIKNQTWPVIGNKAPSPCMVNYCEDV